MRHRGNDRPIVSGQIRFEQKREMLKKLTATTELLPVTDINLFTSVKIVDAVSRAHYGTLDEPRHRMIRLEIALYPGFP